MLFNYWERVDNVNTERSNRLPNILSIALFTVQYSTAHTLKYDDSVAPFEENVENK